MYYFPSQINIISGEVKEMDIMFPFSATVIQEQENESILAIDEYENGNINIYNSIKIKSIENGTAQIQFKIFGLVPFKSMQVNVVDNIYLIPGGQAIGVKLNTKGVLVVSISEIVGVDGNIGKPAQDAGIKVGDSIIEINNVKVNDSNHVIEILNSIKNEEIIIKVLRNETEFITKAKPIKSKEDDSYKLGLWVRDKTAGIGTLTFYHPNSGKFGALGHGITDVDTGNLMIAEDGEILKAKVSSIQVGKKGTPGEIVGIFHESDHSVGNIAKNTPYGIYGMIEEDMEENIQNELMPVALHNEIKLGEAYILTTIDGDKVDKYKVNIVKLYSQAKQDQKSMIIEVIDPELLEKTGGIVQGMSGSPIIQNGKIIGAVTHVFVNNPRKGYGLYIEWMLKEAGITNENKEFALIK